MDLIIVEKWFVTDGGRLKSLLKSTRDTLRPLLLGRFIVIIFDISFNWQAIGISQV